MKKCEFSPLHRPRYIFFHFKFHWAFLFKNLWEAITFLSIIIPFSNPKEASGKLRTIPMDY